jgi:hypothetical protein
MKREIDLTHEFVEYIPDKLQEGTIYVSVAFATVVHKCCCGCGHEVITPLSPTDWQLIFDGQSVSLYPSIGNWNFRCHSHYWIRQNKVQWAPKWSREKINAGRAYDSIVKQKYFNEGKDPTALDEHGDVKRSRGNKQKKSLWHQVKKWLFS